MSFLTKVKACSLNFYFKAATNHNNYCTNLIKIMCMGKANNGYRRERYALDVGKINYYIRKIKDNTLEDWLMFDRQIIYKSIYKKFPIIQSKLHSSNCTTPNNFIDYYKSNTIETGE